MRYGTKLAALVAVVVLCANITFAGDFTLAGIWEGTFQNTAVWQKSGLTVPRTYTYPGWDTPYQQRWIFTEGPDGLSLKEQDITAEPGDPEPGQPLQDRPFDVSATESGLAWDVEYYAAGYPSITALISHVTATFTPGLDGAPDRLVGFFTPEFLGNTYLFGVSRLYGTPEGNFELTRS